MNGIACIKNIEFTVENIEFQRELPNRRVIEILHDKKVMRIFAECGAVPRSIHSEPSFPSEASTPARCAFLPFSIADDHRRAKGRNADFPQKSARKSCGRGETYQSDGQKNLQCSASHSIINLKGYAQRSALPLRWQSERAEGAEKNNG